MGGIHKALLSDVCIACGATAFQKVLKRCTFADPEDRLTQHREELEAQQETAEAR